MEAAGRVLRAFRDDRTLRWLGVLACVWVAELWIAQHRILLPTFKIPEALWERQLMRLCMDLGVVVMALALLPRKLLYGVFGAQLVLFLLGSVYHDYYGRLPKLSMMFVQSSEGVAILPLVAGMLPPGRTAVITLAFLVKCGLVYRSGSGSASSSAPNFRQSAPRRLLAVTGLVVYAGTFVIANVTLDPMTNMRKWGTSSRFGLTYGFAAPLFVEAYYSSRDSFLERALASAAKSTDRLTPVEASFRVHDRIVILQVESLDWGLLDHRVDGEPVIPRLNGLAERSMRYKAEAAHFTGSADQDFVALMGVWPSRDVVTYKIDGYPFESALPHDLAKNGFETVAIHGVSGAFFNRRRAFEEMGLDELIFREELHAAGVIARHEKYDWIQDGELFDFAAARIAESRGKVFHMIITVTSHSPFKELPPGERAKCARFHDIADRYFCSMRYVDRGVGRYLDALPDRTTLVVYGDHNSSIETESYASGRRGDRDWVPVLIHNTGENLAEVQKTRTEALSTDGSLSIVDVMRYVHAQIRRSHVPGDGPGAGAVSAGGR